MSQVSASQLTASSKVNLPTYNGSGNFPSHSSGAMIFDTSTQKVYVSNGSAWLEVGGGLSGNDGSSFAKAASTVQELYDAGQTADGFYYLNIEGQVNEYFVPLQSHPYYIAVASWNNGISTFFTAGSGVTGNNIDRTGRQTPTGNFTLNGTYGYYRNTSTESDFRYATFSNWGISYRYVKMKFNLYNYYSNDGVNGRNFLGISSGVGDGLTVMRNASSQGDSQHIFTYYTAINNNDGNSCPSIAGSSPTHTAGGNNPGSYMGSRYCCFSRSSPAGFTTEYVRNFTPFTGDTAGTTPNSFTGDAWYTVDLGATYTDSFNVVISSDQTSSNEDTYLRRGVVMIRQ